MDVTEARSTLAALASAVPVVEGRVRLELQRPVARLVLDNPGARGAVTLGMMVDLADAVAELARWDGAGVVLYATDERAFCAGGHLGQVLGAVSTPALAEQMAVGMTSVLDGLLALPLPSVCAIRGLAVGGGAEIATATDLRLGSPDARIHFVHARLGIAPGWGGTARLVGILGRGRALRTLLEARPLGADEAVALGLLDGVAADPVDEAIRLLTTGHAPEAVRAIKRQVAAAGVDRRAEAEAFATVWGGPAHQVALEGLRKYV